MVCNGNLSLVLCDHFFELNMCFGNIVGAKRSKNKKFKIKLKRITVTGTFV